MHAYNCTISETLLFAQLSINEISYIWDFWFISAFNNVSFHNLINCANANVCDFILEFGFICYKITLDKDIESLCFNL